MTDVEDVLMSEHEQAVSTTPLYKYKQSESIDLGLAPHSFIYNISRVASNGHADYVVTASDDSLRYLAYRRRSTGKTALEALHIKQNCHKGITCLVAMHAGHSHKWKPGDAVLLTAGRDGLLKAWAESEDLVMEFSTPNRQPISAISYTWDARRKRKGAKGLVAAGTELFDREPPGDVAVYVWAIPDWSGPAQQAPILAVTESHTDTITNLLFHWTFDPNAGLEFMDVPEDKVHLISSSTDGLINIIDPEIEDEEDAVVTVLNNRNAVQHFSVWSGIVSDELLSKGHIGAISQDEKLSVHAVAEQLDEDGTSDPQPVDLRERLKCDYVLRLKDQRFPTGTFLAVGAFKPETTKTPYLDVYQFLKTPRPSEEPHLTWYARLPGAHGEELVRDIWFDEEHPFILTCGEDGLVRAWERQGVEYVPNDGVPNAPYGKKAGRAKREETKAKHKHKPY